MKVRTKPLGVTPSRVADHVCKRFLEGRYNSMTVKEISLDFGASATTVRRALFDEHGFCKDKRLGRTTKCIEVRDRSYGYVVGNRNVHSVYVTRDALANMVVRLHRQIDEAGMVATDCRALPLLEGKEK